MKNTLWFNLEPTEWRATVRSDVGKQYAGRNLQVVCRFRVERPDIKLIGTDERLHALNVHMGIMAGPPTFGDGTPMRDAIGMLVFNEATTSDHGLIEAMIVGWCYVGDDQYADSWEQVSLDNYARSDITVTLGPIVLDRMDWTWDVEKHKQLFIEDISVAFSRAKVTPTPEKKRRFFG